MQAQSTRDEAEVVALAVADQAEELGGRHIQRHGLALDDDVRREPARAREQLPHALLQVRTLRASAYRGRNDRGSGVRRRAAGRGVYGFTF